VADALRGARLLASLPWLVRLPMKGPAARAVLRSRRDSRAADFLALVRRAVFGHAQSPYRRLLALAGCTYDDLERMVVRDGVEATLARLAACGVFLTVDEAKGRRAVIRGSTTFDLDPATLANPLAASHVVYGSSGSRGPATTVSVDIRHFRDRAVNARLVLEAREGVGWQHALWVVPGGAALVVLLQHTAIALPIAAWFSQVDPESPELDRRYARTAWALRWAARAVGARLPRPVWAPLDRAEAVGAWMRRCLDAGETPHVITFPSSAVALCHAAGAAGLDLGGSRMSIGGEPVTPACLAAIRAAGVAALPHYGSIEAGRIGEGCLDPAAPDDMHVFDDLHAVVPAGPLPGAPLPPGALLVSSLRPTAPLVLLNVSLGDEGVLTRRRCGCALEDLGWTTHLQAVRSFEKLTAGGMTLLDTDAVVALEEMLPARFGGSAADYQLAEEEDAAGRPGLVLLVSPRVGPVDPHAVAVAFLDRVGASASAARIAALLWRDAGMLRVEVRPPIGERSGKVLHYRTDPRAEGPVAGADLSR
jgi:hypothetical protein